jgi:putative heme-binding domain-containing protein
MRTIGLTVSLVVVASALADGGQAPPADMITVPEGFTIELLASAGEGHGSWVSMCFDTQGRAIVGSQYEGLHRIDLSTTPPTITPLDVPVRDVHGLCVDGNILWANSTKEPKDGGGLWKLTDTDGDGVYERHERLYAWGGGGEHGAHGIRKGPDGRIWAILGNHVPVPACSAKDSPVRHWAEDLVMEREWDPRGHAHGIMAPGGMLMRCATDGSRCDIVACGMRNACDIDFTIDGEAVTYDSDMEWDIGAPWYRAPRVLHLVEGGDFGWRSGSAKLHPTAIDTLPAIVDTDPASPVGVTFARNSSFPAPWRDRLFIADWSYGRILAVDLVRDGTTWRGRWEPFATGRPMPVTDIEIGPHGAMYVATGGRGTQSGLYRIAWRHKKEANGGPQAPPPTPPHVTERLVLAPMLSGPTPDAAVAATRLATLLPLLGSPDRFTRFTARVAIEALPIESWRARVSDATLTFRARLELMVALARVGTNEDRCGLLAALASILKDGPLCDQVDCRRGLARMATIAIARLGGTAWCAEHASEWSAVQPAPDAANEVIAALGKLYPSDDAALDRMLAELLVGLGSPEAITTTVELLESTEGTDAMAFAMPLRLRSDLTPDQRRALVLWIEDARAFRGGFSLQGFVDAIERQVQERTPQDEREAYDRMRAALREEREPVASGGGEPLTEWKLDALYAHLAEATTPRDLGNGRRVLEAGMCLQCHRFADAGESVGPDITAAGSRFSRADFITAILEPSKVVSDQYAFTTLTLDDGSTVTGRIVGEREGVVTLTVDPYGKVRQDVAASRIRARALAADSPMPARLLDSFSKDDIIDLIAYVEQAGADWANRQGARPGQ